MHAVLFLIGLKLLKVVILHHRQIYQQRKKTFDCSWLLFLQGSFVVTGIVIHRNSRVEFQNCYNKWKSHCYHPIFCKNPLSKKLQTQILIKSAFMSNLYLSGVPALTFFDSCVIYKGTKHGTLPTQCVCC